MLSPKNIYKNDKSQDGNTSAFSLPEFMSSVPTPETIKIDINKIEDANPTWNFFKPLGKEKMQELMNSIRENGLIHPILLSKHNEKYIILSGHNRVQAYKNLFDQTKDENFLKILSQVKENLTEEQEQELIIDSNWVQRTLSVSERTKSIYHKYILIKNQKVSKNKEIYEIVAEDYKLSGKQIQRYLRLNKLNNELLDLLDSGVITLRAGVNIALFDDEIQKYIFDIIIDNIDVIENKLLEKIKPEMSKQEIFDMLVFNKKNNFNMVNVSVLVPEYLKEKFIRSSQKWIEKNTESYKK